MKFLSRYKMLIIGLLCLFACVPIMVATNSILVVGTVIFLIVMFSFLSFVCHAYS